MVRSKAWDLVNKRVVLVENKKFAFCQGCNCDDLPDTIPVIPSWVNSGFTCGRDPTLQEFGKIDTRLWQWIYEGQLTAPATSQSPYQEDYTFQLACALDPDTRAETDHNCSANLHIRYKIDDGDWSEWVLVSRCLWTIYPDCCQIWDGGVFPDETDIVSCGCDPAELMLTVGNCYCCVDKPECVVSTSLFLNDNDQCGCTSCNIPGPGTPVGGSPNPCPNNTLCYIDSSGNEDFSCTNNSLWRITFTLICPDYFTNPGDLILEIHEQEEEGPSNTTTLSPINWKCGTQFEPGWVDFGPTSTQLLCCEMHPTLGVPLEEMLAGGSPLAGQNLSINNLPESVKKWLNEN